MLGLFDVLARITELHHEAVLTHVGGLALLYEAHFLHLLVRVGFIRTFAGATGTVRDHHAAKPLRLVVKALGDAVVRGDFEVVLMRNDA